MIKVSVMYPMTAGSRFDHDYYRDKHMPLVKARMGDTAVLHGRQGLAGVPRGRHHYVGMCTLLRHPKLSRRASDPLEGIWATSRTHGPVAGLQISEVVVERS